MDPQARAELEVALRAMPPEAAGAARAHLDRLERRLSAVKESLVLLAHEHDLHDAADPGGGRGYLLAVAPLTLELDTTVVQLSAAWDELRALLVRHCPPS